jgi:hypothetical protein
MAVHTSIFYHLGLAPGDVYLPVGAIVDQVFGYRNGGHVPSVPMSLAALAATGLNTMDDDTSTLTAARVQSPKTVISPAYVRPINAVANFPDDPAVCAFAANSVVMRSGEEISASAVVKLNGTAVTCPAVIVAWFYDRLEPVPGAESYWVPFTAPLPTVGSTTAWQTLAITFQDTTTLPAGRYAILGMQLVRPDAGDTIHPVLCGRLVIPGEVLRPGVITSPSATALTPPLASDRSLGVWGHFDAQLPPSLEVFSPVSASAATLYGFLCVAQVSR